MNAIQRSLGGWLARYLTERGHASSAAMATGPHMLAACLQPGDVLLVEGDTRVSTAIKYLTQSTWSHAALYVGAAALAGLPHRAGTAGSLANAAGENPNITATETEGLSPMPLDAPSFIEADIREGVRAVPLSQFAGLHCRVCRPKGLDAVEVNRVVAFAIDRLGQQYDLKNVVDLARYLFPTPPVPVRWRRRMLSMGSGDPTRAICSTLIAQCFQSVRYPILPKIEVVSANDPNCDACTREILHVRHHSLFVPRDFDVSPYFQIIKPTLENGFNHRALAWSEGVGEPAPAEIHRQTH